MRLPYPVAPDLGPEGPDRWRRQFVAAGRERSEGLWRRTQSEREACRSGWTGPGDARRRMLYFSDRYAVEPYGDGWALMLVEPFLWVHWLAPGDEIGEARHRLAAACDAGGWKRGEAALRRGDLAIRITEMESHPEDWKAGRRVPRDYRVLEVALATERPSVDADQLHRPWEVLATGVRELGTRGSPRIVTDLAALDLGEIFPAQLELGSGASIEAGARPLKVLHGIYGVIDEATGAFVLQPHLDPLPLKIAASPERFYEDASVVYRRSLTAAPTDFYCLLPDLVDRGMIVGDAVTNNFDGLSMLAGLEEHYVRRYEEELIVPQVNFHPAARSLLVVGSHADRRLTQQAARQAGLRVVFVDPEGFEEGGAFTPYPLEGARDEDVVIRMTAGGFARALAERLGRGEPSP